MKPVGGEQFGGASVARRSGGMVQVDVVLAVIDSVTEDLDDAMSRDLALETGKELTPSGTGGVQGERLDQFGWVASMKAVSCGRSSA